MERNANKKLMPCTHTQAGQLRRVRRRLHRLLRDLEHLHLLLLAEVLQLVRGEAATQLLRPGRGDHLHAVMCAHPSVASLEEAPASSARAAGAHLSQIVSPLPLEGHQELRRCATVAAELRLDIGVAKLAVLSRQLPVRRKDVAVKEQDAAREERGGRCRRRGDAFYALDTGHAAAPANNLGEQGCYKRTISAEMSG